MVFSCAVFGPVHAQPYPNHPVRLIVPYPPGGITDVLARTIAQRVSIDWGQQLPEVPTMIESGLPGFAVTPWWGIFAPAGTPRPVIAKLHHDIVVAILPFFVQSLG